MSQVLTSPPSALRNDALSSVRTRRIFALLLDLVLVSILAAALWTVLLIVTFGLSWFFVPPLFPLVAFFYNGLTVSGAKMATPGMRAMNLEMRVYDTGARVPFINAAAHALFFYLTWFMPLLFIVSLLDGEKRCLHDILSGVIVVRRL
jgi:uncharacterized RDD family membrane protein YckC